MNKYLKIPVGEELSSSEGKMARERRGQRREGKLQGDVSRGGKLGSVGTGRSATAMGGGQVPGEAATQVWTWLLASVRTKLYVTGALKYLWPLWATLSCSKMVIEVQQLIHLTAANPCLGALVPAIGEVLGSSILPSSCVAGPSSPKSCPHPVTWFPGFGP